MLKKILQSFVYAFQGWKVFFRETFNGKVQTFVAILVVLMGFYFEINLTEWCFIVLAIGLVIAFEMMNSAIEEVVNFVSPDYHKHAGKIKDLAAGAVTFVALMAFIIGLIIFLPKLWNLF